MIPRRRRQHTYSNPEARIQQELEAEIGRYVDVLANEFGPAAGAEQISERDKLRMWGMADPIVDQDPEAFKQALMDGSLAQQPEMLDPNNPNSLGIVRAYPEMAQILTEPVDEQMADQIMRYARWPLRSKLLEEYTDDPEGAVKEANRLEKRWNAEDGQEEAPEEQPSQAASAPNLPPVEAPQAPAPMIPPQPSPTQVSPQPMAPSTNGTAQSLPIGG